MESAVQITMVKENLAVAIALWAAAQRGVITGAFLPGKLEFTSYSGQMMAVSTPLELRDNKELLRCVNNQVRGAFAFSVMQTHRVMESAYRNQPIEESDPDLQGARCTLRLLNDALSAELLNPVWDCPADYRRKFKVKSACFDLDASSLDGKKLFWEDFGGMTKYLELLKYCHEQVLEVPQRDPNVTIELRDVMTEDAIEAPEAQPTAISPSQPTLDLAGGSSSADPTEGFLKERCVTSPSAMIIAKDLYSAYADWCQSRGQEPLVQRSFGMKLTGMGFQRRRRGRGRHWWIGIKLTSPVQI